MTVYIICSASGNGSAEAAETSTRTTNPMVKLFCGQFLSAGINEGILLFCYLLLAVVVSALVRFELDCSMYFV